MASACGGGVLQSQKGFFCDWKGSLHQYSLFMEGSAAICLDPSLCQHYQRYDENHKQASKNSQRISPNWVNGGKMTSETHWNFYRDIPYSIYTSWRGLGYRLLIN